MIFIPGHENPKVVQAVLNELERLLGEPQFWLFAYAVDRARGVTIVMNRGEVEQALVVTLCCPEQSEELQVFCYELAGPSGMPAGTVASPFFATEVEEAAHYVREHFGLGKSRS